MSVVIVEAEVAVVEKDGTAAAAEEEVKGNEGCVVVTGVPEVEGEATGEEERGTMKGRAFVSNTELVSAESSVAILVLILWPFMREDVDGRTKGGGGVEGGAKESAEEEGGVGVEGKTA